MASSPAVVDEAHTEAGQLEDAAVAHEEAGTGTGTGADAGGKGEVAVVSVALPVADAKVSRPGGHNVAPSEEAVVMTAADAVHTELATAQADQDPRKDRHGNPACASLFLDFLPAETCAADLEPVVGWLPGFVAIRLGNKKLRQGEHRTCVVEFADVESAVSARMQIQGQVVPLRHSFSAAPAPLCRLVVNFVREPLPGSPPLGLGGLALSGAEGVPALGGAESGAQAQQDSAPQANPYVDEHGNYASKTLFICNLNPALDAEYLRRLFPGAVSVRVSRKELPPGVRRTAFVQLPSVGIAVEERKMMLGHTDEHQDVPLDILFRRSSHPRGGVVLHHPAVVGGGISPVMGPMLGVDGSPLGAGPSPFAPVSPPPLDQAAAAATAAAAAAGGYTCAQGYTAADWGTQGYSGVAPSPYYVPCMPGAAVGASAYAAAYPGGSYAPWMVPYSPYSSEPAINIYGMQGLDMYWGFWRDTCGNPATSILFIDNLPSFVTQSSLSRIFERCPGFQNVHLSRKALLPHQRRTCLAFFTDVYSASCARQMWQGHREANWDHAMVINFKKARDTAGGSAKHHAQHATASSLDDSASASAAPAASASTAAPPAPSAAAVAAATAPPAAAAEAKDDREDAKGDDSLAPEGGLPLAQQRWEDTPQAWDLGPESAAAAGTAADPVPQPAPRARRRAAQAAMRTARGRQAHRDQQHS